MLMPKKHRTLIYEYLMKEGVVVAEKDFGLDKHPVIPVPNIHVIKALQVRWPVAHGERRKRNTYFLTF